MLHSAILHIILGCLEISGLTHDSYLCDNGGYKCFRIVAGVNNFSASNTPTSDTALRPVATVTIAKE